MNLFNISTAVSSWPKGEETFSSTTGTSDIPYPVLILMVAVLIGMLVVWWKSKRNKH